ncbi:SDR family oxidoreductase [Acuticoccus sp. 2012]|uniref:SDR family oxidoreductase n=1 Tax=Acuticoccus mangrovi TaxID=2796142 RepID=A0A934IGL2_9HYPH|nr:SDR family oxidoreductase [Acuticoccus mangrovi]
MTKGVCLITGGSRGIGAAAARMAGARGWDVLINYNANAAAAEAVAEDVRRSGARAEIVAGDVATEAGIMATYEAVDRFGSLTALVNNAGIGDQVGDITTFSFDRVDRIVRLNVTGAIIVAREAVKRMATRFGGKGGSIINISSSAAKLGGNDQFVDYSATKGAIDTFTVGLALEWVKDGIRVNAVRPGVIDTDFHSNVGVPDRPATVGPQQPLGRAGTPEEVAEAIMWLMSDASSYTVGAIIEVSGGRSIVP